MSPSNRRKKAEANVLSREASAMPSDLFFDRMSMLGSLAATPLTSIATMMMIRMLQQERSAYFQERASTDTLL